MRKQEFPERVERLGVVATIYAPKDALKGYTVAYYVLGKFVRKVRNSYEDAKKLALSIVEKKAHGRLDDTPLSREQSLVFRRAAETVKPTGRPLDLVAHEYAQAVKLLGEESLVEAVKFYLANRTRAVKSRTVQEVVTELRENKQTNGRSKLYLTDLKLRLDRFATSFKCPIHTVEPAEIQRFLNNLKVSGRTRNNFRRAIGTLFRFAKVRGYVPAHHTGILEVERAEQQTGEVQVFTPDELTKLLAHAKPDLVPALAIGALAGLRSEEIKRLDWANVLWEENEIQVPKNIAKTRITRLVPMCSSLKSWLEPHRQSSGPISPYRNLGNQFLKLAPRAKVAWKRNGLRHSFISYRVAHLKIVGEVAEEAGNTPKMINQHYRRVVNKAQADSWFGVTPAAVEAWRTINGPAACNGQDRKIVDNGDSVLKQHEKNRRAKRNGGRASTMPAGGNDQGPNRGSLRGNDAHNNILGEPLGVPLPQDFTPNRQIHDEGHRGMGGEVVPCGQFSIVVTK